MSNTDMQPIGVVLLNLGGPDSLDAVEPFLVNLFLDPDILPFPFGRFARSFLARTIARRRAEKVKEYYRKIGGGSPIFPLTRKQAEGLEKELKSQGNFKVLIAMRYWHPTTEEAIDQMGRLNLKRVVLLPLYPQFSTATTESSFKEFERVRKEKGGENWEVLKIPHWYDHPLVIDSLVLQIKNALQNIPVLENQPLHIVFSAHGVPLRLIQKGDPYQNQIEENVRLIGQSLGGSYPIHLCYQSRVGPLRWTGPSTDEMLKDLAAHGVKNLLMIPISFVSDHSETLYEMDILYRDLAHQLGIHGFHRMPSLNDSPAFIKALSGIVVDSCHSNRWL